MRWHDSRELRPLCSSQPEAFTASSYVLRSRVARVAAVLDGSAHEAIPAECTPLGAYESHMSRRASLYKGRKGL
jgi:hypothetical protein